MSSDKNVALVLSGGGAKGAFQAGALKRLDEAGYNYDIISGVSVGALNAAMMAAEKLAGLIEIWQTITADDVYRKVGIGRLAWQFLRWKIGIGDPPQSWYRTDPLLALIERSIMPSDIKRPLKIGRVNIQTGSYSNRLTTLDMRNFHKTLLASASIPVVFPPVQLNGMRLVDGGVRNITPLGDVLGEDPDEVIIITTEKLGHTGGEPGANDILSYGKATLNILLKETFYNDIASFLRINEMVGQASEAGITLRKPSGMPYKYFRHMLIEPTKSLGDGLNFDRNILNNRFQHGYDVADKALEK